jgi:hypothetical protein
MGNVLFIEYRNRASAQLARRELPGIRSNAPNLEVTLNVTLELIKAKMRRSVRKSYTPAPFPLQELSFCIALVFIAHCSFAMTDRFNAPAS